MSFALSPLNQRRWNNFKSNRRAFLSLVVFSVLFGLSLFAEFIANDKPILVQYRGEYYAPNFQFYPETAFGGDFKTEAVYRDPEVKCLIRSGGIEDCFDDPDGIIAAIDLMLQRLAVISTALIAKPYIANAFSAASA